MAVQLYAAAPLNKAAANGKVNDNPVNPQVSESQFRVCGLLMFVKHSLNLLNNLWKNDIMSRLKNESIKNK